MKHMNRLLALLLAALMLCGAPGAVAELDLALEPVQEGDDIALELPRDVPDLTPELQEDSDAILDVDLADDLDGDLLEAPEDAAPDSAEVEGSGAVANVASNEAAPARQNADEAPFVIDDKGTLTRYNGTGSAVTVPASVVAIGSGAFMNNDRLTSVTIPGNVSAIQSKAFSGCGNLNVVNVLAKSIAIASDAFSGTRPSFYTVVGSDAAAWARRRRFEVKDNLVVLGRSTRMKATAGDTLRIFLDDEVPLSCSSSDTSVATVTQSGFVMVKGSGTAQITVLLEGGRRLALILTVPSSTVPYPTAALSERSLSLSVGASSTLTVNNLSGRSVSWSSDNSAVATVIRGVVKAVHAGSCTITATLSDGSRLQCRVTVSDAARLSDTALAINAGYTHSLKVIGLSGRSVAWSSSNSAIAGVKNGKVTAYRAGTCTITAQVQGGNKLQCGVTVRDNASLSRTGVTVKAGGYTTLKVRRAGNRTVTWSSSKSSIASVKGGRITGHKAGTCTVTARLSGGRTLTCKVTVVSPVALSRTQLTLKAGGTYRLKVSGLGRGTVSWSTNFKNVATVDKNGTVTAVGAGKCTITAKLGNGTVLKCKVTVKK